MCHAIPLTLKKGVYRCPRRIKVSGRLTGQGHETQGGQEIQIGD